MLARKFMLALGWAGGWAEGGARRAQNGLMARWRALDVCEWRVTSSESRLCIRRWGHKALRGVARAPRAGDVLAATPDKRSRL